MKSNGWTDHWARRAKSEGWRSRAVYKLEELDRRSRLFRPGDRVVDLGAAPGSWSQYAERRIGSKGQVVAVDIEPMESLGNIVVLRGDITADQTMSRLNEVLQGPADAVISDLAPRLSGNRDRDQAVSLELAEIALATGLALLRPGGVFVTKLFQGYGFEEFLAEARTGLKKVQLRTPAASRKASRETYLVGRA